MGTKGAFLKEKVGNFGVWVQQGVGKENLPVDVSRALTGRSELEAVALAGALLSNADEVAHRDWGGLASALAAREGAPPWLGEVLSAVRSRQEMHEKFWRYLDLFVEVAAQ
jgi:hypothetical protein